MLAPHPPRSAAPAALTPSPEPGVGLESSTAARLLVVVARFHGRFRPLVTQGTVAAGALLGHITGGGRKEQVRAPVAIDVQGLLALPGHLVTPGQALLWAHHEDRAA